QRLVVEGVEAFVEEQALERRAAFGAGGQRDDPLRQRQRQRQRREERLAAGQRAHRALAVGIPVVDDQEVGAVVAQRVAAGRQRAQPRAAVLGEQRHRLLLHVVLEAVGAQQLRERPHQRRIGQKPLALGAQPGGERDRPFEMLDLLGELAAAPDRGVAGGGDLLLALLQLVELVAVARAARRQQRRLDALQRRGGRRERRARRGGRAGVAPQPRV